MAKTDRASNKKVTFFIRLSPFERSEAFQLEPEANRVGRGRSRARSHFGTVLRGNVRGNGLRTFHESNRANGGDCEERRGKIGDARRNRTADNGFADHCLTTWLSRHRTEKLSVFNNQLPARKKMRRSFCSAPANSW